MVHIIVVTHGGFAEGILNSIEMVLGKQEKLDVAAMKEGDDPAQMAERISALIGDNEDGTLILADLFGGSPCNGAAALLKDPNVELVAGVNLPMLIQVLEARNWMNVKELADEAVQTVMNTTMNVRKHLLGQS